MKNRCPINISKDGNYWHCQNRDSGKVSSSLKSCDLKNCPGREKTPEEIDDERLLALEEKIMVETNERKKKEGRRTDPMDSLIKKISSLNQCDFKLSDDESKWYCKKNMDLKMDISERFCYYDDCPGRRSTLEEDREDAKKAYEREKRLEKQREQEEKQRILELEEAKKLEEANNSLKKREAMLARKRELEKIRRERIKAEKLKRKIENFKTPEEKREERLARRRELARMKREIKEKAIIDDETKRLKREERLAKKREQERKRRERIKAERGDVKTPKLSDDEKRARRREKRRKERENEKKEVVLKKCEWHKCENSFEVGEKKKFCSRECQMKVAREKYKNKNKV